MTSPSPTLVAAAVLAATALACAGAPRSTAPAERFTSVAGTAGALRLSDGGRGEPAVVLVHGLGSDLEVWRAQLDHLRRSRRAVAYDQRGHGSSERPRDGVYTIEALAEDLAAVVDALGPGRVVLIGHSLSGAVLSTYAGAHPDRVTGLVYVDAVGDFHAVPRPALDEVVAKEAAPSFGRAEVRAAFAQMLGPAAREPTRQAVLASVDRFDPRAFGALRASLFRFELGNRLASYRGPILAVEVDGPAGPIMASAVVPGARRVTVAGVSHWLQLDDPAALDRALDDFLSAAAR